MLLCPGPDIGRVSNVYPMTQELTFWSATSGFGLKAWSSRKKLKSVVFVSGSCRSHRAITENSLFWSGLKGPEELSALAAVVVPERVLESDRHQRLFDRRQTPEIVGRADVMHLRADEEARPAEEGALRCRTNTRLLAAELVRRVAVDDRVIELAVIEDRGREAQRGRKAVNR